MDALLGALKQSARDRELRWKLVCCGPRDEALHRFRDALRSGDGTVVVLLVDAEGPTDVERLLERATAGTQKGRYHKIRHASDLLQWIDPETVKTRCRHCERLFIELERLIDAA